MAETYAIAGAVAAVNAIKAAEHVPELKGKTTTIKAVAIIQWIKSISKHQVIEGTALGEVVLKMSKLFDWPAEEIVIKAWELAREDKREFATQYADLLEKVKEGISGDLWGAIKDQDPQTGRAAIALLIKAGVHRPHAVMAARIAVVGNIEVNKWDTGLTKDFTQLLSALTEMRYSPFYTYCDLRPHIRSSGGYFANFPAYCAWQCECALVSGRARRLSAMHDSSVAGDSISQR